jgi:hypothetical protein
VLSLLLDLSATSRRVYPNLESSRRAGLRGLSYHLISMPSEYEIDPAHRLVRVRAWGVLTHAEVTATRVGFISDPAFRPDFSQIYDAREVTSASMTGDEIRDLASYSAFDRTSRRAFVVSTTAAYGVARMMSIQREATGGEEQIRVFRSVEDANKWLGLE